MGGGEGECVPQPHTTSLAGHRLAAWIEARGMGRDLGVVAVLGAGVLENRAVEVLRAVRQHGVPGTMRRVNKTFLRVFFC